MNKSPVKKNRFGEKPDKARGPLLLALLNGASLLSFLFCAAALFLYAAAVRGEYDDAVLFAAIRRGVYGGVALGILSLYRFFAGLWFCIRCRRPLLLISSLGFLLLGILGGLMAAALSLIGSLTGGNVS
ncbi:MAG: hypothetical protein LBI94_06705 [Treponema sp.]|jgi:hypothetical protein|nr:hypothetical protein [Treponema sp.]